MKTILALVLGLLVLAVATPAQDVGSIGLVILDRKAGNEPLRTGFVYPGSPAERAGIKPDGFLISVNRTNVVSLSTTQAISLVRGPVGTHVMLEIADATRSRTNRFIPKRCRMISSGGGPDSKVQFLDR